MTNDGGAYSALDEVSRSFMPIRIAEPGAVVRPSHISEFIDALLAVAAPHPFVALAPIFYNMRSWVPPERDGERSEPLKFASSLNTIIQRLNWQVAFTGVRQERQGQIKKGFTSTIVDVVNDRSDVKRVIVVIRLGSDQRCYKHGKDLCLTVNVPKCVQQKFIDYVNAGSRDGKIATALELGKMRPWDPKEPWKGSDEVLVQNSPDLSVCQPTLVSSSNGKPIDNELLDLIIPHANEHSLYIDSEHSLIYIFSNVVQAKTDGLDYQRGCGGLFIVVNNKALADKELVWLHQAKSLSDKLANRIIHEAQIEEIERQSRAAAISQVLARTLSHNLGSHSLNAFSGESAMLGQFKKLEEDIRTDKPIPGRVGLSAKKIDKEPIDTSKRHREWLATYNNYLRERMDLLADITTAVPAFEMPKQLVADLLEGYSRNILLATTIAGTGGRFRYCWQPEIQTGDRKDVNVAIPSDVLGAHAFYLILENIVRNSAKHGGHSKEVVFTVRVTEPDVEAWKRKGLLQVQITENCTDLSKNEKLVADRNASINAPVLDEKTRRVRDKGWGTLEMKAACAYLRRVALEELDEKKYQVPVPKEEDEAMRAKEAPEGYEPPLLRAIGGPSQNEDFGYEFYLLRPKLVLVCGAQNSEADVIADAFPKEVKEADLQNHGIGAITLNELEAITGGHRKQVVNHALLVFLADDEAGLKRLIQAALQDLAALPHEMVIVGCEKCDAKAFQTLLTATKEDLKGDKNRKLSPASIEHNASILERSVVWVERSVWKKLSSQELEKLYMEVRHRWLVGWMDYNKYSLDVVPRVYEGYLCDRIKGDLAHPDILIEADYEAHDDLYIGVKESLGMQVDDLDPKPDDLSPWVLAKRNAPNPRHVIIQRYPEALSPVMTLGWKRTDSVSNASIKDADKQTWGQHHLASWTQGVAVIDERVQAVAESETYQPAASEKNNDPQPIRVKDLLCMGGVFVPPGMDLQRSDAFTQALWDQLVGTWLAPLHPMLGYVCIHLTILEKFSRALDQKMEGLIDMIKLKLPGIRIIVVSGRGKPPELPSSELFMSYSALAQYTTQTYQRAPVLLNILAHSARRIIPS